MKKLALISVCILGLAIAGSASTKNSMTNQTPVKKEAPATTKTHKKAPAKKVEAKKEAATPAKPAVPAKK